MSEPAIVPLPTGVLGYVVARVPATVPTVTARMSATHCDLMPRDEAEREAALWACSAVVAAVRYVVCEVRQVTG
jgi:hypothetical protein